MFCICHIFRRMRVLIAVHQMYKEGLTQGQEVNLVIPHLVHFALFEVLH